MLVNKKIFISASLGLLPLMLSYAESKKNILFILCDQMSWQTLGVYGNTTNSTPTIDSLANTGIAFSRVYTACPLSMPARAALWTGQYPHVTKVESNGQKWQNEIVSDDLPTMGEVFSNNGYECVHFGKQHDSGALRGFKIHPLGQIKVEDEHKEFPLTKDSYVDVHTMKYALEYLNSTKGNTKPFFCVVDLNNPHNICAYIGAFQGKHDNPSYPNDLPELPSNFVDPSPEDRPRPVQYMCCSHRRLRMTTEWTPENYRHYLAAYYYYSNRLDRDVASLMKALKSSGNAENTLIVFLSDHGEGMAAKRMVTKQGTPYDQTTRVPLVFTGAGIPKHETTCDKPLVSSSLDVFPTLCEYAGIEIPKELHGKSLLGWIDGGKKKNTDEYVCSEWTTEFGFTVSPFRMIRTDRYKYVKYLEDGAEELYDMEKDPDEVNNLVKNNKYKKEVEYHRTLLAEHIKETSDNFYEREVKWDTRVAKHKVGYENHVGLSALELKPVKK